MVFQNFLLLSSYLHIIKPQFIALESKVNMKLIKKIIIVKNNFKLYIS